MTSEHADREPTAAPPPWHAMSEAEALKRLDAAAAGLSGSEAAERLNRDGPNRLAPRRKRSALVRLLAQFHNVLIYALLAAGTIALLLEHPVDALVIFGVVIVNTLIGFIQEGRAEAAMASIGQMLARTAEVRRDGRWQRLDAAALVVGDCVRLREGDRVPADLRLLEVHGLRAEEAALTGESLPVGKQSESVDAGTSLGDRRSMAWSGTMIVGGSGLGVVVATAEATEIGRIERMLGEVRTLTTPLLRQMNRFAGQLTLLLLALTVLTVLAGIRLHGLDASEAFVAGVALMVAAIPEGLPAIITITLAIGVRRMADRKAIVRRLPAVETLGAVTVICSDKTGTLTRNQLQATRILIEGADLGGSPNDSDCGVLEALLSAAVLCNDAEPGADHGDPLERALLQLAERCGRDVVAMRRGQPRCEAVPFSSSAKWMATAHECGIVVKGAPEVLLQYCDRVAAGDGDVPLDRERWQTRVAERAATGQRLLALADAPPDAGLAPNRLPAGLRLLGVVAFEDPLREGVVDAVARCLAAGIRVKIITGDHPETARAIAARLDLGDAESTVPGTQLDTLDGAQLSEAVDRNSVFARTTSAHKLRLVEALQARGEVVAMTGDGANDAPALKRADIGVAMGIKGTEAAREAADIVLTDDDFSTIVAGIEEGRGVHANIRKSLLFLLPTSAGEALVILLAILAGVTLPLTPIQVLWVNMVTAITLALALAFEPVEREVMRQPPRSPAQGLISLPMLLRILWVAAFLAVAVFWIFEQVLAASGDEALARCVALNLLVACEATYLFNCRRQDSPGWTLEALTANPIAWSCVGVLALLQLVLVYWTPMQALFGLAPLSPAHWLPALVPALVLFGLVELEKALFGTSRPAAPA